jgi:phosphoglycolate phosphatase-like HAD superfamily hydrolase
MEKRNFVLFDFDGVIADTYEIAYRVGTMVCPAMTRDDHRRKFEGNVNDWFKNASGHTAACKHDLDWWEAYVPLFREGAHPFPGSIRAVQDIGNRYRMAVISSTISSPIDEFLRRYGARDYFAEIFGNDVHASKVEKINMLFVRYDLTPRNCVFVTDTLGDMDEARQAGVDAIGGSWGFHERERLQRGKPFRIVDRPHELLGAVDDYFVSHS